MPLLDPTNPTDASSPTLGAADMRTIVGEVQQMFGGAGTSPVTFAVAPFITDTTTGLSTVPGVPTATLGIATKGYVDGGSVFTGTAAGTNTYTTTLTTLNGATPPNQTAIGRQAIIIVFTSGNTGAATLNANGFGAFPITKFGANPLVGGEIPDGSEVQLIFDGARYQLQNVQPATPATARAFKPSDQSVTSSTALVNDNALFFSIAANEVWQFEIDLYATFDGASASGIKAAFTVPSGATLQWIAMANAGNSLTPITASGSALDLDNGGATATGYMSKIIGQVLNGATPGTVQFQWAQNTSDGTATTVKAGSSLIAIRLNP